MPPTLRRTLGLRSVVLFGLAYLTPLIVLGIFGVVAETTAGASPSAYALALVAMLFTALSYGRMAAAFPVAGSAYTYVRRTVDSRAGFLVGWAVLLDYFFLPMVIWLIGGSYLSAQFPSVPSWLWILAFIVLTTGLNLAGIKVADRANSLLMVFQILVLVFFVLLSAGHLISGQGAGALFDLSPFTGQGATLSTVAAGAAIAAYSFLGFDAVTTLTEETVEPTRTIPRAILLVALIGGGIFVLVSYVTQLVHPGGAFADSSAAASEIARTIGGSLFGAVFLAGLVVAQFTSGLAAQASTTRLLYAMGRDAVLPAGSSATCTRACAPRSSPSCSPASSAWPPCGWTWPPRPRSSTSAPSPPSPSSICPSSPCTSANAGRAVTWGSRRTCWRPRSAR
ncbi:APC family permease [Nonomuraea thailandensis]